MYCKHCGKEIPETANFCDGCGKPSAEERKPVSETENIVEPRRCPKCGQFVNQYAQMCRYCGQDLTSKVIKEKKKRKSAGCLLHALIIILILASCGAIFGDSDKEPVETTPAITEAVENSTVDTEQIVQETYAETTINQSEDIEIAVSTIERILDDNFDNYDLSYDDTGITVNIWSDGVAIGAKYAATIGGEYLESWDKVIENFTDMSRNLRKYLDTLGLNDVILYVSILNDQNKENVLAMIVNDVLIYDAVHE